VAKEQNVWRPWYRLTAYSPTVKKSVLSVLMRIRKQPRCMFASYDVNCWTFRKQVRCTELLYE